MLVVNQLISIYECKDDILQIYHEECCRLLKEFKRVTIEHVPKLYNGDANWLAQHAYGYRPMGGVMTLELPADDFWPTMLEDCFTYYKGCQGCQKFGNVQRAPASAMNPIIKPWPFRGWGIDLIGQIYPPSSKNHKFILVATDYFTKWVEAISLSTVTSKEMIQFVKEHIVYRFGTPQTITTDQGSMFISEEFGEFAASMGIKLLNSSPYYAQANGQA